SDSLAHAAAPPDIPPLSLHDALPILQAISDSLDAAIRVVSDSLQAESRRAGGRADPTALYDRLRLKLAEGRRLIRHALEAAQGVLTPDQWARLPDAVKTPAPR